MRAPLTPPERRRCRWPPPAAPAQACASRPRGPALPRACAQTHQGTAERRQGEDEPRPPVHAQASSRRCRLQRALFNDTCSLRLPLAAAATTPLQGCAHLEAGQQLREHLRLHHHLRQVDAVLRNLSQRAAHLQGPRGGGRAWRQCCGPVSRTRPHTHTHVAQNSLPGCHRPQLEAPGRHRHPPGASAWRPG